MSEIKRREKRTYLVGLAMIKFRLNLLIKVKANNDYCALLEAMKKFTKIQAEDYPEKREFILDSWKAEEKMLTTRYKTFTALHDYLCCIGFIVSKPLILKDT